jgi:predicted phosphoribosyltransferase
MDIINEDILKNKNQAIKLLGEKLIEYKKSNAIVLSVSRKSVVTAYQLAMQLHLPLQIFPCWEIKHPGNSSITIGSVCDNEVILHDEKDIPRDFIAHQIQMIQHSIKHEQKFYQQIDQSSNLESKTIIIAVDILENVDTIHACLASVKKQNPFKIIVAALLVAPELMRFLSTEIDKIEFIKMESDHDAILNYEELEPVSKDKARALLIHSTCN